MPSCFKSFKSFDRFNLFIFSRTRDGQTCVLLRKEENNQKFIHFSGSFTNQDPSILLTLAKKFLKKSSGLLCSQNFPHFAMENPAILDPASVMIENNLKLARPAMILTPALNDICKLVCESPYFFQGASNTATYFLEIPILDLEKLNQFASSKGLYQFKYFTGDEILSNQNDMISQKLQKIIFEDNELKAYTQKYIVDYTPVEITDYYGIICCEMFARTHLLHALHFPVFKKHGESWRFYKAYEKDLPTEEDLKKLKGLIIPGSSCSVYNSNIDWYHELFTLIRKINQQYSRINLLGICFGAQAIAQALGGKVEKMKRDFIDGGEVLKVTPEFYELPYVKSCKLDAVKQLVIAEAHNDHIIELPPMAKHYGSSENTNVEIFTINKNILAFQGHPDYNEVMVIRSSLKTKALSVRNYSKYEQTCIKSKFADPLTQKETLEICFNFLKQQA